MLLVEILEYGIKCIIMLDRILLYDYCLSVYFAGTRKHDKYRDGTWFIFAMKYFYLLIALTMFILSKISYTLPNWCLGLLLIFLAYISYFRTGKWVERRLNKMMVERIYKKLTKKRTRAWLSLLFLIFMFFFFFVVGVLTFEGYSFR